MKVKLTTSHPITYNPQMGPVTELIHDSEGYDGHNNELQNWLNLVNMPLNKIIYPEGDDKSNAIRWFKFEVLDNMGNLDTDKKEYEPINNGSKYYK